MNPASLISSVVPNFFNDSCIKFKSFSICGRYIDEPDESKFLILKVKPSIVADSLKRFAKFNASCIFKLEPKSISKPILAPSVL